ncbi:MAG: hypothetical protein IBX64_12250 [Actinobacteria bacterium]|nr:hypothetical protein [Actinomycetota bacterium]
MTTWQTKVQAHPSGDGLILMPADVVKDKDFRPRDVIIGEALADDTFILCRAVRLSRLLREWNQYQRRITRSGSRFVVLRNNEPVADIGPADVNNSK